MSRILSFVVVAMTLLSPVPIRAEQASGQAPADPQDLAKQLSNPISSLVSLPFQFNWEQNVGPDDQTRLILNVQPVMPFSVSADWNLIARVIVPLISQPPLFEGGAAAFGVGDIVASFFVSPSQSTFVWGVGPVVSLPSTTVTTLGTEKWSTGPTAVVLRQAGPWTLGTLWNQVWSFSGNPAREDVNQMFLQPFVSYQATRTLTFTLQSETTANWEIEEGRWTVPINAIVSKLSSFGTFPASYQVGVGAFAVHPDVGPSWKVRAAIVILLPRRQ